MPHDKKLRRLVSPACPGGERVARLEAQLVDALIRKADAAKAEHDIQQSEYFMRRAVAVSSYNETKAHLCLRLGQLAEQQRRFDEAVENYGRGIVFEPCNPWVVYYLNNNMGYSLCMVDRHVAAEPYCRTAIEVDRKRHNAHKNLGLSLRGQQRIAEAARSLASAAILWPHDRRALGHLEELVGALQDPMSFDPVTLVMIEEAMRVAPLASESGTPAVGYHRIPVDASGNVEKGVVVPPGRPWVIVIVDDEPALREVLSAELRSNGFVVFSYGDKRQFLDELYSIPVDLILTDLNSPGMRGMELLRALKSDTRWRSIPVIIMSGGMTLNIALEAKRMGVADCMTKPYDYRDLLACVQQVLGYPES